MRQLLHYLKNYLEQLDKIVLLAVMALTAILVWLNYSLDMNGWIRGQSEWMQLFSWFAVLMTAFGLPYILYTILAGRRYFDNPQFIMLLIFASFLFAWKMSFSFQLDFSANESMNQFWNAVAYWPFKLAVVLLALAILRRIFHPGMPFYGLNHQQYDAKPYLLMLALMAPLIAAATTQPDFLQAYPRFNRITSLPAAEPGWLYFLLFELSYGTDFITIEIFFRGFLVLGFARYAGKDVILPMAVFYCAIHFGKPMAECISSFFGGTILGVITYHTRSIYGGLIVHLGIAWLMELGGYLGNHIQ